MVITVNILVLKKKESCINFVICTVIIVQFPVTVDGIFYCILCKVYAVQLYQLIMQLKQMLFPEISLKENLF